MANRTVREVPTGPAGSPWPRQCAGAFTADATVVAGLAATAVWTDPGIDPAAMQIIAFDAAQEQIGVGEANTVQVTSFTAPSMTMWGLDDARKADGLLHAMVIDGVRVYRLDPVLEAGRALLAGFPLQPGSFVPAACKHTCIEGPAVVGAALGYGIPADPSHAGLLMEAPFTGPWAGPAGGSPFHLRQRDRVRSVAASVLAVGKLRDIIFAEVWAGAVSAPVPAGYTGCGLVYCPYLRVPGEAFV
jgi:pyruvoyl-dependent arginine decarboxylase (PvlArgDC)